MSASCNAGWHAYAHPDGASCPVCKGTDWTERGDPDMSENERDLGLRVVVDGTSHSIHDDVPSMSATLRYAPEVAEVQIARVGFELVVIVAGDVEISRDQRGFLRLSVQPTTKIGAEQLVLLKRGTAVSTDARPEPVPVGS